MSVTESVQVPERAARMSGPDLAQTPACPRLAGGAARSRLAEDRWHFQHGPIDLIIDVDADAQTRDRAIADCWDEFQQVLSTLVGELPDLRRPSSDRPTLRGPVAQRMLRACAPFSDERFITPMAAVAGSVADHLITAFKRPGVRRASINNGGDIALWLSRGSRYRVGVCSDLKRARRYMANGVPLSGVFTLDYDSPVRGVATSGWRGRSFSRGIADSVTVLAVDAAAADAAATLIANAVNCDHPGITRAPAAHLKDDSDLGNLLITVGVARLPESAVAIALARGRAEAERWRDRGLVYAAAMFLQEGVELVLPRACVFEPAGA